MVSFALAGVFAGPLRAAEPAPNSLTPDEAQDGWTLLWNGKSTEGWSSARDSEFPKRGWEMKDGVLSTIAGGHDVREGSCDILTRKSYSNFELTLEFKLTPGAKTGIVYFVDPDLDPAAVPSMGLVYQIVDDENADAKLGRNGNRTCASLYDLMPPAKDKKTRPIGEWNSARIIVRGPHVEHWLNGELVLAYTRFTPEFRRAVSQSHYKSVENFGELPEGPILLQNTGGVVSFRNIKLRILPKY